MSQTYFHAPEDIQTYFPDVEKRWATLANALGNEGKPIALHKEQTKKAPEDEQLGFTEYEFNITIGGEETVFQSVDCTSVRWYRSFYLKAPDSKKAKTAILHAKYHVFKTIHTLRIMGTDKEIHTPEI